MTSFVDFVVSSSDTRHGEGCLSHPEDRRDPFKIGGCNVFLQLLKRDQLSGRYHLGNKIGRKRVCLRTGSVTVEKDVVRSIQRDSHFLEIDVTSTFKSNKEIRKLGNVLRG